MSFSSNIVNLPHCLNESPHVKHITWAELETVYGYSGSGSSQSGYSCEQLRVFWSFVSYCPASLASPESLINMKTWYQCFLLTAVSSHMNPGIDIVGAGASGNIFIWPLTRRHTTTGQRSSVEKTSGYSCQYGGGERVGSVGWIKVHDDCYLQTPEIHD